jgi:REP element-mobilizing transposase RayT
MMHHAAIRSSQIQRQRFLFHARKREKGIWQRHYWEHAIRDDADLERHVDCIHFNPVKHGNGGHASLCPPYGFGYASSNKTKNPRGKTSR